MLRLPADIPLGHPADSAHAGLIWNRLLRARRTDEQGDQARLGEFCTWASLFAKSINSGSLLSDLNQRRRDSLAAYPWCLDPPPQFSTNSRLAVGLGNPAPAENSGLTLHHTYGFPLIPAASLRGIARRYLKERIGYTVDKQGNAVPRWDEPVDASICFECPADPAVEAFFSEVRRTFPAQSAQILCTAGQLDRFLFGDQDLGGGVAFFDAWPLDVPNDGWFEVDVLTPHHPDYYSEKKDVADDSESPNINAFVVIRRGVTFAAPIASPIRAAAMGDHLKESCLMAAEQLLIDALDHFGVGSRTGAGYGRMLPT